MSATDDWAARLAAAIASQFARRTRPIHLHSIKIESPEVVEVIFSDLDDLDLKGVRIDSASVRLGSERVRLSSIDELAFDVITLAISEPRSIDEFLPPDSDGIRWLPLHRWLDDA